MKLSLYLRLLISCFSIQSLSAQSVTIYRGGAALSPSYTTIKAAVAASVSNDSLVLSPHIFYDYALLIDHNLKITGTKSTTDTSTIYPYNLAGPYLNNTGILFKSADTLIDTLVIKDLVIRDAVPAPPGDGKNGGAIFASPYTYLVLEGYTHLYHNSPFLYTPVPTPSPYYAVNGAAVYSMDDVLIKDDVIISDNDGDNGIGAGVYCLGKLILQDRVQFYGNSNTQEGGAIYAPYDTLIIRGHARIYNNESGEGGGISASVAFIGDSVSIESNTSSKGGAGIKSSLYLQLEGDAVIKNNIAYDAGGGILLLRDALIRDRVSISRNGSTQGGGIYSRQGGLDPYGKTIFNELIIEGSVSIDHNSSIDITGGTSSYYNGGGGVFVWDSLYVSGNVHIADNASSRNGGGIWAGFLLMRDSVRISNNMAYNGGGVFARYYIALSDRVRIDSNTVDLYGGAIYSADTVRIQDSVLLWSNNAEKAGGVYVENSALFLSGRSVLAANHARGEGGAVYLNKASLYMQDSAVLVYNSTDTNRAAAIYSYGDNEIDIQSGQIVANHSTDTALGLGMALYAEGSSGYISTFKINNARIFNPRADNSRQNEIYNLHPASAFLSDTTWWGESDTSGLMLHHPATIVALRNWVVCEWVLNGGLPIGTLASFPLEARFTLNTGHPFSANKFWMLPGYFACDSGSFSPDTALMSSSNIIQSLYNVPATTQTAQLSASVDADSFLQREYVTGLGISPYASLKAPLSVYPNPSKGHLYLNVAASDFEHSAKLFVELWDMQGKLLTKKTVFNTATRQLPLSFNIPSATYLLLLSDEQGHRQFVTLRIE